MRIQCLTLLSYQVKLTNRFDNQNGSECLMTVDGTDYSIQEPSPFSSMWYSHKTKGAALRYEIAICIQTGWIVWTCGPFPAGDFPDLEVFRLGLKDELMRGGKVETDEGYRGADFCICTPSDYEGNTTWRIMKGQARARHETINRNLKEFNVLRDTFCHDPNKHYLGFHAVVAVVQSEILSGRGTYQIEYCVRREVSEYEEED